MVISLEFKGKSHRYNHYKADLDPTLIRIFFLNQYRYPILMQPNANTGAEQGIAVTAGVTASFHSC
jgi:hypothetical protein